MSSKVCFYNRKNHCTKKLTKEHVVSDSVLRSLELSGNGIALADVMNNVPILDYDPIIKDVCIKCNNERLSDYDKAGKALAEFLRTNSHNSPLTIPFGNLEFGWLLKTHLNFFRVVKDKMTGKPFKVSQKIKNKIIDRKSFDNTLCFFLARQIDESDRHWDNDASKKLPSYHYNSKRLFIGELIYSHFQIRQLDTILLLPIDADYKSFSRRVVEFIELWKKDPIVQSQIDLEGYELIDIELLGKTNRLPLTNVMTVEMLEQRTGQAFNADMASQLAQKRKRIK